MIRQYSRLRVADNSGARVVEVPGVQVERCGFG